MALTKEDLQAISALLEPIRSEIGELRKDVTELKRDVAGLKWDVTGLKQDVAELKQDVAELKQRMDKLEQRMDKLDQRVDRIEIMLENETNRNIKIVAEGHRDLNRRLSEALKVEDEKETLLIRVNLLERDVRTLKEKVV